MSYFTDSTKIAQCCLQILFFFSLCFCFLFVCTGPSIETFWISSYSIKTQNTLWHKSLTDATLCHTATQALLSKNYQSIIIHCLALKQPRQLRLQSTQTVLSALSRPRPRLPPSLRTPTRRTYARFLDACDVCQRNTNISVFSVELKTKKSSDSRVLKLDSTRRKGSQNSNM